MAIAKGRTNFETYLDDSFFVFHNYLNSIPLLIANNETANLSDFENIVKSESDSDIRELKSNYYYPLYRFEDYEIMRDIFYKSYLVSLCSFCECFAEEVYRKFTVSIGDEIEPKRKRFSEYCEPICKFVAINFKYDSNDIKKIFELRNFIVHNDSKLDFCDSANKVDRYRINLVAKLTAKNHDSLMIKSGKLTITNGRYLNNITNLIQSDFASVLSKLESELRKRSMHISPEG